MLIDEDATMRSHESRIARLRAEVARWEKAYDRASRLWEIGKRGIRSRNATIMSLRVELEELRKRRDIDGAERTIANHTIKSLTSQLDTIRASNERLAEDAARWRAFISSARFKVMGSANFDHSAYPQVSVKADRDPRDWLHFGLEVWDKHRGGDDEQGRHGRNLLMAYVDHRVEVLKAEAALIAAQEKKNG